MSNGDLIGFSSNIVWGNITITWEDRRLSWELSALISGGGNFDEEIYKYDAEKREKLITLILKIHGNTITERKQKEIKQYKIKAKDIKLVVKEVLGIEMLAENISF